MELALSQLTSVFTTLPEATYRSYLPHLNAAMDEFGINSPIRITHFLGQLGHESVGLLYMEEIADGSAYEGRVDLGNVYPGDGTRYKGRGPIQLTGRANYAAASGALGLDLEGNPARAAEPDVAFRIAGWYWSSRSLNALADLGDAGFDEITRRVNGGFNGYEDRLAYYTRAKEVLGIERGGTTLVFPKIIIAAASRLDGMVAHLMAATLDEANIEAFVADENNIAAANADCWPRPVGSNHFLVVGSPALKALPAEAQKVVLPWTPANEKKTDYRNLVGKSFAETASVMAPAALDKIQPGLGAEYLKAWVAATATKPPVSRPAPAKKAAPASVLTKNIKTVTAYNRFLVEADIPYFLWRNGVLLNIDGPPAFAVDLPAPDPQSMDSIFCAGVGNVDLRKVGKPVPKHPTISGYDGGIVAWQYVYGAVMIPFDLAKAVEGAVAFRFYVDEQDQGHWCYITGGPDDPTIQSFASSQDMEPGVNADYTLRASHDGGYYTHLLLPQHWLA